MKKQLTKVIFLFSVILCFSFSASAQEKENQKKGERKPPVIVVAEKKTSPKDKSKDRNEKRKGTFSKYIRGKDKVNE